MEKKAVEVSACRLHQVRTVQGGIHPGPVLWNLVNRIDQKDTHRYKIYCIRIKMCGESRMVIGFEGE